MKTRKMFFGAIFLLTVLVGTIVWAIDYFALFKADQLADGPVIVDQAAVPKESQVVPYSVERVVTGLEVPWSLVFTSNDRWLVSERKGTIRVVEDGVLQAVPLITFEGVSTQSEEGLMGLALDPDYAENKLVYACYAAIEGDGLADRIVRFEDMGDSTTQPQVILDDIPAARFHAGCRLGFGPDGKLYITTGDATDKDIAQDIDSLGGKILRVNSDGSIPDDNPFEDSAIWSLGHRNPQGIAWQPGTDQLFATEHGPSGNDGPAGGDEVNIIEKGANYGWPIVSHEETDEQFVSPLLVFTPAVAPSGATFYSGSALPQFTGDLFFTGLRGEALVRVVFSTSDPSKVAQFEKLPDVNVGRIRDVVEGPGEAIYFMTSNRDGRGDVRDGDDAIYRIVPK